MKTREAWIDDALQRLFARVSGGMRYDLQGIRQLLAAFGRPTDRFDHVLLVGTNGKGSTAALLADSLRAAGHRVGRFTSPHLFDVQERICIDGVPIDDAALGRGLVRLEAAEAGLSRPYTFFEGLMAIAAELFAERGVTIAVWEAGLGGRLDATNALPTQRLRAVGITPIGLDHQSVLGPDLAAIAAQKAGVMRPDVPVVSAPQAEAARTVIAAHAREVGVPYTELSADARVAGLSNPAAFLQRNAALADALGATLDAAGVTCPPAARHTARARFGWPGRYQWVDAAPGGWLIDAGHNPHGTAALAAALADDPRAQGRRIHLVFGALSDKPIDAMLAPLRAQAQSLHVVPCPSPRSHTLGVLQAAVPNALAWPDVRAAIDHVAANAAPGDIGVVTGSLTLVAHALETFMPHDDAAAPLRAKIAAV